ncbi:MAG: SMI1/KNR4 family protein [Pseudomonadota bacterium]
MNTLWIEIEEILAARNVLPLLKLNEGASVLELEDLEAHVCAKLPVALRQILLRHNGQSQGFGLFFGLQFLPVAEIKSNWDMWRSLEDDGLNEELSDSMSSEPPGFIRPLYLNRGWIPFTHDHGGNHIGIDFDPDTKGTVGQIIAFGRDDDVNKLKASSFEQFLGDFASQLRTVKWEMTEKGWQFMDHEQGVHYHDWKSL